MERWSNTIQQYVHNHRALKFIDSPNKSSIFLFHKVQWWPRKSGRLIMVMAYIEMHLAVDCLDKDFQQKSCIYAVLSLLKIISMMSASTKSMKAIKNLARIQLSTAIAWWNSREFLISHPFFWGLQEKRGFNSCRTHTYHDLVIIISQIRVCLGLLSPGIPHHCTLIITTDQNYRLICLFVSNVNVNAK